MTVTGKALEADGVAQLRGVSAGAAGGILLALGTRARRCAGQPPTRDCDERCARTTKRRCNDMRFRSASERARSSETPSSGRPRAAHFQRLSDRCGVWGLSGFGGSRWCVCGRWRTCLGRCRPSGGRGLSSGSRRLRRRLGGLWGRVSGRRRPSSRCGSPRV